MPIKAVKDPKQLNSTSTLKYNPLALDAIGEALNAYEADGKVWEDGRDQEACFGGFGYVLRDEVSGATIAVVRAFNGRQGPNMLIQSPKNIHLHAAMADVVREASWASA